MKHTSHPNAARLIGTSVWCQGPKHPGGGLELRQIGAALSRREGRGPRWTRLPEAVSVAESEDADGPEGPEKGEETKREERDTCTRRPSRMVTKAGSFTREKSRE